MEYTHLIVTKVNIKWLPQSRDEVWLKNRINILNNILRPSLEAQTNKNFKFITLWGYEPIGKINNEYQIMINSENDGRIIYREFCSKLIDFIDEEYVLTTRIDTDNAFSFNFVENIHNHIINDKAPFYYDIKKMNMIDLSTKNKTTWNAAGTSGFISVMEKKEKYKCIPYSCGHGTIGKAYEGIKYDDLDALLIVHGDNIHMTRILGTTSDFDVNKYNLKIN